MRYLPEKDPIDDLYEKYEDLEKEMKEIKKKIEALEKDEEAYEKINKLENKITELEKSRKIDYIEVPCPGCGHNHKIPNIPGKYQLCSKKQETKHFGPMYFSTFVIVGEDGTITYSE